MSIKCIAWALNTQTPPGPRFVLVAISQHVNQKRGDFLAWPSVGLISELTGHSRGAVKKHIRQLVAWGLIERTARTDAFGRQTSNLYRLRLDRTAPQEVAVAQAQYDPSLDVEPEDIDIVELFDEKTDEGGTICPLPSAKGGTHVEPGEGLTGDPSCMNKNSEPLPPNPLNSRLPSGLADHELRQRFNAIADRYQIHGMASCIGDLGDASIRFRKLTLDKIVMAEASIDNFIKGSKAAFARWKISKPQERARKAPKLRPLKDYLGFELWNSIGIPSEPKAEALFAATNAEMELCRAIIRTISAPPNASWAWLSQGSANWLEWQRYFNAHGFSRMPLRRANFADSYDRGAIRGEEGWVFPRELPPTAAELITETDQER